MTLSFKRDMTHNYMVPESEETLGEQDYQIHMMMENHIEGLLPCSIKRVNGKSRYFYDITSRQSMESIYEKEHIRESDIRILLKGLYTALLEVRRYLLDTNKVVLDPQMIYMDIETKEPLFSYLPVYQGEIQESFHQFASLLLQKLDQNDTEAVLLGYEIYRRSMEENYSLEKLLKEAAFGGKEAEQISVRQGSVLPERQKPEEKEILLEQIPLTDQTNNKINKRTDKTAVRRAAEKAVPPRKKRRLGLAVICVMIVSVTAVAGWFWKLSVTQLGGISFLLAGILAYGISAEEKRKKNKTEQLRKQEEKADRRSVKKMETVQKAEPVREKIGATVLLSAGEEEYEPHLSLISMSPRERNSVVLLNESYTIGKLKNKTDIYIDHPSISRTHAKIQKEGKEYFLYDLNSTNGTFVNGRRLAVNERVRIQLSDEIRFADLGYYVGKC